MKKFVPNDQKTKEIEEAVAKKDKEKDQEEIENDPEPSSLAEPPQDKLKELKEQIIEIRKKKSEGGFKALKVEEFEKDVDENYHIDFIYAMANIRASNYGL